MPGRNTTPRTLLGQRIAEMRMTLEEFAEHVERYARDHNERGTLSVRHLQRLVAGRRGDGRPLGPLNPATARLLERIFGDAVECLLAPPPNAVEPNDAAAEFCRMLASARRVDKGLIQAAREQLGNIRRIDRQLGASVVRGELLAKIVQVSGLLSHSLGPASRAALAAVLSEMESLAGWQALDLCDFSGAWQHYERARIGAAESQDPAFQSHATAEQAFVLLDVNQVSDAVAMTESARAHAEGAAPAILRSWLAAAHGECLAASGERSACLRAFDKASQLLTDDEGSHEAPYVALDAVHLARWRGHALARLGESEAVSVLSGALKRLDPTFTRAETGLRIDLATALARNGDSSIAHAQALRATALANEVGSARQRQRLGRISSAFVS